MLQRSYCVKCHYPLNSVSEKHNRYNKRAVFIAYYKIGKYPIGRKTQHDRCLIVLSKVGLLFRLRQGSNELDSSCSRERSSPVMLSAAKHLAAARDRPFAEFTLSGANVLRVTGCDSSNGQGFFFTIEPCLNTSEKEIRHPQCSRVAYLFLMRTIE